MGPDRRKSSPQQRQAWYDSHPQGVIKVAVGSFLIGSVSHLAGAVEQSPSLQLVRDGFYTVAGSAAAIYVGQRLVVFALDRLSRRMEEINALPEQFALAQRHAEERFSDLTHKLESWMDEFRGLHDSLATHVDAEFQRRDEVHAEQLRGLLKTCELRHNGGKV